MFFFRQNIISQEFAPALLTTINTKLFCHEKMFLVNDITFFLRFDLSLMNIKSISCFSQLMITINLLKKKRKVQFCLKRSIKTGLMLVTKKMLVVKSSVFPVVYLTN